MGDCLRRIKARIDAYERGQYYERHSRLNALKTELEDAVEGVRKRFVDLSPHDEAPAVLDPDFVENRVHVRVLVVDWYIDANKLAEGQSDRGIWMAFIELIVDLIHDIELFLDVVPLLM